MIIRDIKNSYIFNIDSYPVSYPCVAREWVAIAMVIMIHLGLGLF